MVQHQILRNIEQILTFLEDCVPVKLSMSKMNGGFHQYVGLQRFDTNWWCVFCEIQLCPLVLKECFEYGWSEIYILWNSIFDLPISMPSPRSSFLHLSVPISWCWKIDCHLVASVENTL